MLRGSHSVWFRSRGIALVFSSVVVMCSNLLTLLLVPLSSSYVLGICQTNFTKDIVSPSNDLFFMLEGSSARLCLRLSQFLYIHILHCIRSYPELTDLGIDVLALSHTESHTVFKKKDSIRVVVFSVLPKLVNHLHVQNLISSQVWAMVDPLTSESIQRWKECLSQNVTNCIQLITSILLFYAQKPICTQWVPSSKMKMGLHSFLCL